MGENLMNNYLEEYTKLGKIHCEVLEEIENIIARLRMIFFDNELNLKKSLENRLEYLEEKQGKLEERLYYLESKIFN
jgi:hypothetical protein